MQNCVEKERDIMRRKININMTLVKRYIAGVLAVTMVAGLVHFNHVSANTYQIEGQKITFLKEKKILWLPQKSKEFQL